MTKVSHHARSIPADLHTDTLKRPTLFKVASSGATVRSGPMGVVMGNLRHGDHFVAEKVSHGGWVYGYAEGHANKPGWVHATELADVPKADKHHLPKGFHQTDAQNFGDHMHFARHDDRLEKAGKKQHYTTRVAVNKTGAGVYANYDANGKPEGKPLMTLKQGDHVGVRYYVNKHLVGVEIYPGNGHAGHWAFMKVGDLERFHLLTTNAEREKAAGLPPSKS